MGILLIKRRVIKLEDVIKAKAKAKERQGKRNDLNIVQKSAPSEKPKSTKARDELARIVGVSHDTIEKSEVIKNKGTEEQIQRARDERLIRHIRQ